MLFDIPFFNLFPRRSKTNKDLYKAVIEAWDEARSWKTPDQLSDSFGKLLGAPDLLKDAMILGDKDLGAMIECHEMYIGLAYLVPGTVYPTHAHDATELYHALVGTTKWGPCERHAKPVEPDNFVYHPSAIPHWFGVSK